MQGERGKTKMGGEMESSPKMSPELSRILSELPEKIARALNEYGDQQQRLSNQCAGLLQRWADLIASLAAITKEGSDASLAAYAASRDVSKVLMEAANKRDERDIAKRKIESEIDIAKGEQATQWKISILKTVLIFAGGIIASRLPDIAAWFGKALALLP